MARTRKPKTLPACPPPERRVVLAIIGAPHGVRGEVRVKAFTADPLAIADYGPLFSVDGRVFEIEDGRPLKDDMLVVRFAGLADRDLAKALTGTELFVDRAMLPEPEEEEFYHADLIGLTVADMAGAPLGEIVAIHDFGAGDVIEFRPTGPDRRTWLVPFSRAAVPKVEIAAGRVLVEPAFITRPEAPRPRETDGAGEDEAAP